MLSDYTAGDFKTFSIVYAVLVITISLAPLTHGPANNLDKIMHALLYYGFAFVLWRGFSDKRFFLAAFFLGVLIEFMQPTFGRAFDYFDMLANGTGIFLFYYFSGARKNL